MIDGKKVAQTIRSGEWDTVLGPISYDAKGDITTVDYMFYRWNSKGGYDEIPDASRS
jgi:branched-chain amino acid transport system substrate-binding protein